MPMEPRTPEEEGAVYNPEYEEEPVEREIVTDRSKADLLDDKIASLEEKKREKELIREKKSQIRRLQYSPVYKGVEAVAGGIKKTVDKFSNNDKTPEEKLVSMQKRQMRKERMQRFMKSMEKFGDTGSYDMGSYKKTRRNTVSGGKELDFFGNGRRNDLLVGSKKKNLNFTGNSAGIDFIGSGNKNIDFFGKSNLLNTSKTTKSKKKKKKSKKNKMRLM